MTLPALRRRSLIACAALALSGAAAPAFPQGAFPQRAITLVVPNAAGGAADVLARAFGEELSRHLGQPVVVENLGGASGALAAQRVLRAPADGYTLLFGTTSDLVVTPIANRAAGYTTREFTPVAKVGITPMTLVARPGLNVTNAEQLAALARQKPQGLTVGVTGTASLQALAAVSVQRAARIDLLGVPYKGGAPVVTDLLGGQIDLAVLTLPAALPLVRQGKAVMLGVLSEKRSPAAPEQPTLGESPSFRGVAVDIWAAVMGPSNLPPAVVERLNQAARLVLEDPRYVEARTRAGDTSAPPAAPADLARFVASEEARYRELASGLKLE